MHKTSNEGKSFFLNNMLVLIMMDNKMALQDDPMKIKDICNQVEVIVCRMEEEVMVVIMLKSLRWSYVIGSF